MNCSLHENGKPAANIRVAAVGATRGVGLVHRFWHPVGGVEAAAICDLNEGLAREKAVMLEGDQIGRPRLFTDIDEMLRWGEFDVAIVATSDATHYTIARRVFEAGHHCFVEKPMTTTIEDAEALLQCWRSSGRIGVVGHEFRYMNVIRAARQQVEQGRIGRPRLVTTMDACGRMGSYWRRKSWRTSQRAPEQSLTLQKAIHQLDVQMHLMGSRPTRVFASAGQDHYGGSMPTDLTCDACHLASECVYHADRLLINGQPNPKAAQDRVCVFTDDVALHDNQVVTIDYESGARGSYVECFFTPDYKVEHTIIGDLGRMVIRIYNGDPYAEIETSFIGSTRSERTLHPGFGGHGGGDDNLAKAFLNGIREGRQIRPDITDGFDAVALATSIDHSVTTRIPQSVPKPPVDPHVTHQ